MTLHPPQPFPFELAPAGRAEDALPDAGDRLFRLFELGVELLRAIAPHPEHPAMRQAEFLKQIREAGLSGRRAVGYSRPGSPLNRYNPLPPSSAEDLKPHTSANQLEQQGTPAPPSAGLYSFPPSYGPTPIGSPRASAVPQAGMGTGGEGGQMHEEEDQFASLLSDMFQSGQPYLGMDFNFAAGPGGGAQGGGGGGGQGGGMGEWGGFGYGEF